MLPLEEIPLHRRKINGKKVYLKDIFAEKYNGLIPSNTIINKTLPNLGATTCEIDAKRNSIIIEPNSPVIDGKCLKNIEDRKTDPAIVELLGVKVGVSTRDVRAYIERNRSNYKKIICTPESFEKVKKAIKYSGQNLYNDYFLLFDECDKVVSEIDFRTMISLPMNDFFRFSNKAFISATPIIPQDKRFANQNFKIVKIKPAFTYKRTLELVATDNIIASLRKYINDYPNESICIFTNCTRIISSLIADLQLQDDAHIFCSERLIRDKFKGQGIKNTFISIKPTIQKLARVNFFSSRFFSAVDILTNQKPHVLLVSNSIHSPHSIIDPQTDAIQIPGRFRKGIKKLLHFTNINPDLPTSNLDQLYAEIQEKHIVHRELLRWTELPTSTPVMKDYVKELIELSPLSRITDDNCQLNSYMADNYIKEQYVKSFYNCPKRLASAYDLTKHFKVILIEEAIKKTKKDRIRRDRSSLKARKQELAYRLEELYDKEKNMDSFEAELQAVRDEDPLIYMAYHLLGLPKLIDLDFNLRELKVEILKANKEGRKSNQQLKDAILIEFRPGETVTISQAVQRLQALYNQYLQYPCKAKSTQLLEYFNVTHSHSIRVGSKQHRGFKIKSPKIFLSPSLKEIFKH